MAAKSRITFLFDENSSVRLVRALRELDESAYHATERGLKSAPDEIVLEYAGSRDWAFVSSDRAILRRGHERAVIAQLGMAVFFLNDSLRGFCTVTQAVVLNWPDMKRLAGEKARPALFLVRANGLKSLPVQALGAKPKKQPRK